MDGSGRKAAEECRLSSLFRDTVYKPDALEQPEELFSAVEPTPAFFALASEFEHHGQCRCPAAASLGLPSAMSDPREARFDRIGRAEMDPVFGWEVVKRSTARSFFRQLVALSYFA